MHEEHSHQENEHPTHSQARHNADNMHKTEMKERKFSRFANWLLGLAIVLFVFGSGYRLGEYKTTKKVLQIPAESSIDLKDIDIENSLDLSMFWRVWSIIRQKYADQTKVKKQTLVYGAIKGMVEALNDPYSYFMTPNENKQSKEGLGGIYEGIGAQLGLKENAIIIIAPLKNSPAYKAGLKPGDYIVGVNKESTKGWTLPFAVSKIKGPKNTKVTLTIVRAGVEGTFDLVIVRQSITVESVELTYAHLAACGAGCPEVANLKLSQFGDNTNKEWDTAVLAIKKKWDAGEIKGMVLDLRSNPGGYLESSVYLAGEFLPAETLVVRQEYADKTGPRYLVERKGVLLDIPLVVLIDGGSASASEILAGALRDHKRAVTIGVKSFGKGSVQEAIDLEKGAGLHITIAKWVLPGGDWINSKGITPQIEVVNKEDKENTLTDETDAQLQRAIQEVLK